MMKTVLAVITATADYFARNRVDSPRLNIEHLLAHVLGKRRMDLYLEFDRPLSETELAPLRDLVRRRAEGEPLQHLLGTAEFMGLNLRCDKRALIPRQETEQLCELLLAEAKADACPWKRGHIADVGTGSGCIALALASALPEARVTAVDLSDDALALARENATRTALVERVTILKSDLLSEVPGPIDLLVANLPYIPSAEISGLQREVLRDPMAALDGGADGLVFVRRLLEQAQGKLAPGARIALELAQDQPSRLAAELSAEVFHDVKTVKDYSGRERYLFANFQPSVK
jgi:release factor glutamine methyltransferase